MVYPKIHIDRVYRAVFYDLLCQKALKGQEINHMLFDLYK